MNFGELKTAIEEDTHRSDLTSLIPRFVREAEGLIRRDLRGYLISGTLTDTDRVADGLYNVPGRLLEIRSVRLQGRQGDGLTRVNPDAIRRLSLTADPWQYAQNGDGTIEFRGNPSVDHVFDILYYGTPAPLDQDTDTNELLTDHEGLYLAGAKFYLYIHTQDRELASDELDIFEGIKDTLNEQLARQIGGATIAPRYNMSSRSSY